MTLKKVISLFILTLLSASSFAECKDNECESIRKIGFEIDLFNGYYGYTKKDIKVVVAVERLFNNGSSKKTTLDLITDSNVYAQGFLNKSMYQSLFSIQEVTFDGTYCNIENKGLKVMNNTFFEGMASYSKINTIVISIRERNDTFFYKCTANVHVR